MNTTHAVRGRYVMPDNDLVLDGLIDDAAAGVSVGASVGALASASRRNKQYILKIKDMPSDDKPREKLLRYGAGALSVAELIAVLLNTGTTKEDVMTMSHRVLKEYGEQALLAKSNPKELSETLGIPMIKAMQIVVAGEIGRRFYDKKLSGLPLIRTAKDVHDYVKDMYDLPKEHLRGIYLNTHHRIIHDEIISIGTINSNLIHPREVFKPAIEYGAAGIVLVHNHPSGVTTPSIADIEITRQLVEVGKMVGINLIDHVIITADAYASVDVEY